MKVAIIGAGISGLSIGHMLKDSCEVDIYESKQTPGGLIRCERVNGNLFHLVGGHVFNSRNTTVLEWFWNFFDKDNEFLSATRNAKILLEGDYFSYPIENGLFKLDKDLCSKIIREILVLNKQGTKDAYSYENFEAFLRGSFGETLFELYFKPYNEKIWKKDLKTIPLEWLEGKLPMPNYEEIILKNVLRGSETNMVHSTFFYPKRNGSQFIINRLSEGLNVYSNQNVTQLARKNDKWVINNNEYHHIIYTGDIRLLNEMIKEESPVLEKYQDNIAKLRSNGTSNVLCECDENDMSWLYLPGKETDAHRIIYTGNFSETNNEGSKRRTCVVEFSGNVDNETMFGQLNRLPGNLKPLATNYQENSYIIHDTSTKELIENLKTELEPHGISLLGRFAEWEYFNMDACIESSMKLSTRLKTNKLK